MQQCISGRKLILTHRCYGQSVRLVLKFTTSFSVSISTNKKNFFWKSLAKTGACSEHCETNMTEGEECTPRYRLSPFLDPGRLLFNYILRTISNLESAWWVRTLFQVFGLFSAFIQNPCALWYIYKQAVKKHTRHREPTW